MIIPIKINQIKCTSKLCPCCEKDTDLCNASLLFICLISLLRNIGKIVLVRIMAIMKV